MGANATTSVPTYTAGQVLEAADLNITNSGAPVFADSTARDAAFGGAGEKTLAEGQLCYLEDSNVVQYYDGSTWATVGPASAGSFVYLTQGTFSSVASVSMAAGTFTTTYKNYKVILRVTSTSAAQSLGLRVNVSGTPQTGATYNGGWVTTNTSGTVAGIGSGGATSATPAYLHSVIGATLDLTVFNPTDSSTNTSWSGTGRGATSGNVICGFAGGDFQNVTENNDGLTFVVSGTFGGTYYVYGIKDS